MLRIFGSSFWDDFLVDLAFNLLVGEKPKNVFGK